jgi:phosphate transport system ATP-binding protein
MNDLIPIFRFEGKVSYHGQDIYDKKVDPVVVRRSSAWCSNNRTRSR